MLHPAFLFIVLGLLLVMYHRQVFRYVVLPCAIFVLILRPAWIVFSYVTFAATLVIVVCAMLLGEPINRVRNRP